MDGIRGGLAVTMCFLFGHVYYQEVYKGNIVRMGQITHMPTPVMDRKSLDICPRCGKDLKPRFKPKKPQVDDK